MTPRFTIYRAICESLEAIDRISDASMCFLQVGDELAKEAITRGELGEWVLGGHLCMLWQAAFVTIFL